MFDTELKKNLVQLRNIKADIVGVFLEARRKRYSLEEVNKLL
jgi:hypothetical protein